MNGGCGLRTTHHIFAQSQNLAGIIAVFFQEVYTGELLLDFVWGKLIPIETILKLSLLFDTKRGWMHG